MANVLTVGVLIVAFCGMRALGEPGSSVPSFYDDVIKICSISKHLDFLDDLLAPDIDIEMKALNTTPSEKCINTYKNNGDWSDDKICKDLLSFFQVCELQKLATPLEEETSTPVGDSHFEKDCKQAKSVSYFWISIGFLFIALTLVFAVVAFWVYNTNTKCADLAEAITPDTIQAGTDGAGLESVI